MPEVVRIIARLNIGGPAIHTVLATSRIAPRFETLLVTGVPGELEGDMRYYARDRGVTPVEIHELGREISMWDDLRALVKLVTLLRRVKPAIVHTHTAKAGTLGRVAAILAGVPIRVHTFHGHVFEGYFPRWKSSLFLQLERLLARFTSRLLTVSEGQRRELVERFRVARDEHFSVIPLGLDLEHLVDCEQHRGELRAELGFDASTKLVGIVGRLVPIKNHSLFLQMAKRVADPKMTFLIVGGGEKESALRGEAEALGLTDCVRFLGWRKDLDRIYADLDAVALTSRNEGTPVALIEAMSAGVPVVATAVGGVGDVLRDGARGELVGPPFSPEALADALKRALAPASRERARQQRRQIAEEYGAERLCRDLEALYTRLLQTED